MRGPVSEGILRFAIGIGGAFPKKCENASEESMVLDGSFWYALSGGAK